VNKIISKDYLTWKYVPTKENPADLGSRGCDLKSLTSFWWEGPNWISDEPSWPKQPIIQKSVTTEDEKRKVKQLLGVTVAVKNDLEDLLSKFPLVKYLRIVSWVNRFIVNCRKSKVKGPLSTDEISLQRKLLVKQQQRKFGTTETFKNCRDRLNLELNSEGLMVCSGRIQGDYPIFIPKESVLSEKLIEEAHKKTIHVGVTLTMTKLRSDYWIPSLRQLVKRYMKTCYGCKRFHITHYPVPVQGPLPVDRTTQELPFKIIGTVFAGPFTCKTKSKKEVKVYLLLFTCSLTRAVHLEILSNQTTQQFIKALKKLIARRKKPKVIYSDNAKTFISAANWIKKVNNDEKTHEYLNHENIKWKFNLSRAPWWGGQFERMVGLVKQCLYKTTGRSNLLVSELEEIMLDIEVNLNNRPLMYLEDDITFPTLTPNTLIYGQPIKVPEEDQDDEDDNDMKKRKKYIQQCKDAAWKR